MVKSSFFDTIYYLWYNQKIKGVERENAGKDFYRRRVVFIMHCCDLQIFSWSTIYVIGGKGAKFNCAGKYSILTCDFN